VYAQPYSTCNKEWKRLPLSVVELDL
jgi:hypothetical protein